MTHESLNREESDWREKRIRELEAERDAANEQLDEWLHVADRYSRRAWDAEARAASLQAALDEARRGWPEIRKFVNLLWAAWCRDCTRIDGGDIHDLAQQAGIVQGEPYDAEKHGESADFAPGDTILVLTPDVKSALAASEALKERDDACN